MDQNYLLKTKTLWPLSTALHIVCFSFLASWHNVHKVLPAQCRCTHSATSGVHCTKVLLNLQPLILPPTSSPPLQSVSTLTFFPLSRLQFSTFMNCLYKATNLRIIGWLGLFIWNSMRDSEEKDLPLPRVLRKNLVSSAHKEAAAVGDCRDLLAECCDPLFLSHDLPLVEEPTSRSCSA